MPIRPLAPCLISSAFAQRLEGGAPVGFVRRLLLALALGTLTLAPLACTRVPQLEDKLTDDLRSQPYPTLLPLNHSQIAQAPPRQATTDEAAALEARAARLRRRAAQLQAQDI